MLVSNCRCSATTLGRTGRQAAVGVPDPPVRAGAELGGSARGHPQRARAVDRDDPPLGRRCAAGAQRGPGPAREPTAGRAAAGSAGADLPGGLPRHL